MVSIGPELECIQFSMFTSSEIRAMSVLEIKTPLNFNTLGHALKGGLYDPLLGPYAINSDPCTTCGSHIRNCPGHFGHIELALPVVSALCYKPLATLIRFMCLSCGKLQFSPAIKELLQTQLNLVDSGYFIEAKELETALLDMDDKLAPEVIALIVKQKCEEICKGLDLTRKVESTKILESVRAEIAKTGWKNPNAKKCKYCNEPFKRVTSFQNKLLTTVVNEEQKIEKKMLLPDECRDLLRKMYQVDGNLIKELFPLFKNNLEHPTDVFFLDVILVTPPKTRPVQILNDSISEHSQSMAYKEIIQTNIILKAIIKKMNHAEPTTEMKEAIDTIRGETIVEKLHTCWLELQRRVDGLLDQPRTGRNENPLGLKQVIEKKTGILRMHMMGKRVNYAARTVITPDPNLSIDEIGIPEEFAKTLTYPVPVTYFNVEELRQMVKNGPDIYPGANIIENDNGSLIRLEGGKDNERSREAVAKLLLKSSKTFTRKGGKIVHRHLLNGDKLLLNRQPTLHRPSIMAHSARVLKNEKTLRMHYSNCKSYNADFDGDEMNAHFPQNELARSEAFSLVNVANQYLVPKDGTPLGGLIQDHIIAGVKMTVRGRFFNKQDYHQLVYQATAHLSGDIKVLPPALIKPAMLWSGKQIISTVLLNIIPQGVKPIFLKSSAKIKDKSWQKEKSRLEVKGMSEADIIIRKGELLCGVLDKQHYGSTPYSLVHCLYELYGGECATKFLSSLSKLFTAFLQWEGFTISVEDILVTKKQDKKRKNIIKELRNIGNKAAISALELTSDENLEKIMEEKYFKEGIKYRATLDRGYKTALDSYTNEINRACLTEGLIQKFPENNLQLMVTSGAKGSTVNTMQISCLLGQIELEGKRPPLMISGKSLPSFKAFDTSPRSGGFVDGRFMTGLRPQEFFFHCMAGREGLIDTAVKTSRSGYLQRCLIKHLEGVMVNYDMTVRDTDGSVIQFAYGEDGMDVGRAKFLKKEQMDFLYENHSAFLDKSILKTLKEDECLKDIKSHRKLVERLGQLQKSRKNFFTKFCEDVSVQIDKKHFSKINPSTGRSRAAEKIIKKWLSLDETVRNEYGEVFQTPDPVTSKFKPDCHFTAITEKLDHLIDEHVKSRHSKRPKLVRDIVSYKYMTGLAPAGEPVGLLAAQSIGEPSTQMTLNTFHFAGRGEMNVTLGIPRLREILMTASKYIATPYIDIPFKPSKKIEKRTEMLKKAFQRVTVADVLEEISVSGRLELSPRCYTYTLHFHFLPYQSYKHVFIVKPKAILKFMENKFLSLLSLELTKIGRKKSNLVTMAAAQREKENEEEDEDNPRSEKRRPNHGEQEISSDEDEAGGDDDATQARIRAKHDEIHEYDDPDDTEIDSSDEEAAAAGDGEQQTKLKEDEMVNAEQRQNQVINHHHFVKEYKFDIEEGQWCEIVLQLPLSENMDISHVIRRTCQNAVIYEVKNIKRAIVYQNQDTYHLKTEGINMSHMHKYNEVLDLNKLYTNNVHEMAETYGIEAARRVIVKEIQDVFKVYGIEVDQRHLFLIADYMTYEGVYLPMNRTGMANGASPFQQQTFESSINFLKNAILYKKFDWLKSASSRVMIGQPCLTGTGCLNAISDIRNLLDSQLVS